MLRWFVPFLLVLVTAGPLATLAYSPDSEKQAIRAVIESVSSAIDSADLPLLLAQFAEDAVIDSKIARAKVSKQKYAEAMAAAFRTHELIGRSATSRSPWWTRPLQQYSPQCTR